MPKRKPASITHHHHHHHHYVHHTIKREATSDRKSGAAAGGKGYASSRRAELLQYSQRLRQSAIGAAESSSSSSTIYVPNPNHTSNPKPQAQIVTVPKKPKNSEVPTCFGNCKIPTMFGPLLTSFQAKKESKAKKKGGDNASNRIKAAIETFKVHKRRAFLCNLFSSSAKQKRN